MAVRMFEGDGYAMIGQCGAGESLSAIASTLFGLMGMKTMVPSCIQLERDGVTESVERGDASSWTPGLIHRGLKELNAKSTQSTS